MAKLMIITQCYENYAWNEDGTLGTGAEAYWKPKGGSEYFVLNVDVNRSADVVAQVTPQIEIANDAFTETVIGWEVVADDYMTDFEKSQLEYEGAIRFPAAVITI